MIRVASFDAERHVYTDPQSGLVVPSCTQVLESVGLVDYRFVKQQVLDHKSDIGNEVHFLCSVIDRGENLDEFDYDSRLIPYLDSYRSFKDAKQWKPILVEHGPFIADVHAMPVGFTLDRVGNLDGQEAVGEIKCTAADQPSHSIQLAGYDLCLGERKRVRFVIRLQADGRMAKLQVYQDQSDYSVFLSSLAVCWWKRNHKIGENGNGNAAH